MVHFKYTVNVALIDDSKSQFRFFRDPLQARANQSNCLLLVEEVPGSLEQVVGDPHVDMPILCLHDSEVFFPEVDVKKIGKVR